MRLRPKPSVRQKSDAAEEAKRAAERDAVGDREENILEVRHVTTGKRQVIQTFDHMLALSVPCSHRDSLARIA